MKTKTCNRKIFHRKSGLIIERILGNWKRYKEYQVNYHNTEANKMLLNKTASLFLIALLVSYAVCSIDADAATITAASASYNDVNAAITAASPGDTVSVPSGSATWSSYVTITKGITIKGSGQDATILTANNSCLFSVTLASGADFRIQDMGFTGTGGSCGGLETQLIRLSGNASTIWNSLRAHHLKFTNINTHAFTIDPWWNISSSPKALFDHITLTSNTWSRLIKIAGNNSTWGAADNYGTDDAVFIEDSTFTWTNNANGDITDTEHGVRLVVRHNTVSGGDVQMHDTGSTPAARGQRVTEIYNNSFNHTGSTQDEAIAFRGGGYIVYNNQITGYNENAFPQVWRATVGTGYLGAACNGTVHRACNTPTFMHCSGGSHNSCSTNSDCSSGTCVVACTSNSDCPTGVDGTATCLANIDNVDGGSDSSGYPCRDQTGRGQEYGTGGRYQYPSPVYWYNNGTQAGCATGGSCTPVNVQWTNDLWTQLDRDICNHDPATSCGGKAGWAYTPYTYPHPMQADSYSVLLRVLNYTK